MSTASLLLGGSGEFTPESLSGVQVISSGASGTLVTIPCPAGKRLRLSGLVAGGAESDISITKGGVEVISGNLSSNPSLTGSFKIAIATGNVAADAAVHPPLLCKTDEDIVIEKVGTTTSDIQYCYEVGV